MQNSLNLYRTAYAKPPLFWETFQKEYKSLYDDKWLSLNAQQIFYKNVGRL